MSQKSQASPCSESPRCPSYGTFEVAVYGKGGIGKSTCSANLSMALAQAGNRVLQIGCDPKHDSTRQLVHGAEVPTVLDLLKETPTDQAKPEDILVKGTLGIGCIEAGGPKPGVGCAGRGIITAFEFLNQHQVKNNYDLVIYDVLGDVVCGGFAVPVRREYADAVFLVTSGEYMAIYAANNILRGIRNFDGTAHRRVAGIIFNQRGLPDEDGRVNRFAQAAGLPICAKVPRSDAFARAEEANCTVMELQDAAAEQKVFTQLAGGICPTMPLFEACPLEDDDLERVVLRAETLNEDDSAVAVDSDLTDDAPTAPAAHALADAREAIARRRALYGCAFNGAAVAAAQISDAQIIAHAPRSCAFFTWQTISSPGRRALYNRGVVMPSSLSPNFECTDMDQAQAVFGGTEELARRVEAAVSRTKKPGAVIVLSGCVPGIIGDDISQVESLFTSDVPVLAIPTDGDIAGDYEDGIRLLHRTLADRLIDHTRPARNPKTLEGRLLNIVGEVCNLSNAAELHTAMRRLTEPLGIRLNCRFLGGTTCAELAAFQEAPLSVRASNSQDAVALQAYLSERFGCHFMEEPLPVGFNATVAWLRKIGAFFTCEQEVEELIARESEAYYLWVEQLRPVLAGKRVFLTTINANIDWLLDTMDDIGMELVYFGVANYMHQDLMVTNHSERYPDIVDNYDWALLPTKIAETKPDIVLSNYTSSATEGDFVVDVVPMIPVYGFDSALHVFSRWASLMETKKEGAWKDDRALFEKHFAR